MKKKLLAVLTAVVFTCAMPLAAFADEPGEADTQTSAENFDIEEKADEDNGAETVIELTATYTDTFGDDLTWSYDDTTCTLTISGTGDMPNYTSAKSTPWYSYYEDIASVVMDDGVTSIGNYSFRGYSALESVTIADSVTTIGNNAFRDCTALTSIDIPDSAVTVGSYAFYGCTALTSIDIPDSVTSLGSYAFYECTSLANATLGSGIESIGDSTFLGCTSLTSIGIPDNVTSIGKYAFKDCSALTSAVIGSGVTSIGTYAFSGCTALTTATLGSGVESIGTYVFYGCTSLESITIPESVTTIGENAFGGCGVLEITVDSGNEYYSSEDGVLFNKDMTELVQYSKDKTLSEYTIPDSVTSIGKSAFSGCSALTSVTIPDSVTSIGMSAFYGCSALTSVTLGSGVENIGTYAFRNCSALINITIPDSVTTIGSYAFSGCTALASIEIPDSVTSMGSYTFYGCTSLSSVTLGSGITSIGDLGFRNCTALTSVTIPDGVASIGTYAFYGCSSLESVTIGSGVASIGNNAFANCSSLVNVYINQSSAEASNLYSWSAANIYYLESDYNLVLSLVPVSDDKDGEYYITLTGIDSTGADCIVNRFMSAQLKFKFDETYTDDQSNVVTCDITKIGALSIEPNADIDMTMIDKGDGEYEFNVDGENTDCVTATSVILGTATITGVGAYSLSVDTTYDTNQAHGAESANNIVNDFYYDDGTGTDSGYLLLDSTIPATGTVKLDTTELTINIVFPNAVDKQNDDYTAMHISIEGLQVYGEDSEAYEIDLGTDTVTAGLTEQTITYYTDSTKDDTAALAYTGYTVTVPVYVNYRYSLKFTGDGYRTCNTSIIPTGDGASVTVWNNVMDSEYTIITVNDDEEKTADVTFLAGDICMNGAIDLYDLSAVVSYFGKTDLIGSATYDTYNDYDLNRDGKIDSKDIAMVLVSWGK